MLTNIEKQLQIVITCMSTVRQVPSSVRHCDSDVMSGEAISRDRRGLADARPRDDYLNELFNRSEANCTQ